MTELVEIGSMKSDTQGLMAVHTRLVPVDLAVRTTGNVTRTPCTGRSKLGNAPTPNQLLLEIQALAAQGRRLSTRASAEWLAKQ